jgi:processive 1,2-diacylglycerol beta-glucosyltransferase
MAKAKNVLILYITERSGHHSAALAIKRALELENPCVNVVFLKAIPAKFPIAERVTHRVYLSVIKRAPKIWDRMYDNPRFVRKTSGIQEWVYRRAVKKFVLLMKKMRPDVIIGTQAFPVGIAARYKRITHDRIPLVGVLTDFFPHAYWVSDQVDKYIVPCEESARFLEARGVDSSRILPFGIPIDGKFVASVDREEILANFGLSPELPIIMIMGGGHGLGPIPKVLKLCDASEIPMQFIVACGINKKLYRWLSTSPLRRKNIFFKYTDQVHRLMSVASVLITKPGGITTAEALAKHVPMIILNPIPGQEARNTELLVRHGAASAVGVPEEVLPAIMNILVASKKRHGLFSFLHSVKNLAKPDASTQIARWAMQMI